MLSERSKKAQKKTWLHFTIHTTLVFFSIGTAAESGTAGSLPSASSTSSLATTAATVAPTPLPASSPGVFPGIPPICNLLCGCSPTLSPQWVRITLASPSRCR